MTHKPDNTECDINQDPLQGLNPKCTCPDTSADKIATDVAEAKALAGWIKSLLAHVEEQAARIAELIVETESVTAKLHESGSELNVLEVERDQLQAKCDAQEKWLRNKSQHAKHCMKLDYFDERDHGCTCGLDELLATHTGESDAT